MDPFQRVFSNFGWSAADELAVRVIGMVIAVYLARALGASLYGAIGFMLALVGIFATSDNNRMALLM